MFTDDKSIENFKQLFIEFKKYLELEKDYAKLEIAEKVTTIISTLIIVLVMVILGMVALFYLMFSLAYILQPLVGGLTGSYAIIAGITILLMILIYVFRKPLIVSPMVSFLAGLLLNNSNKK